MARNQARVVSERVERLKWAAADADKLYYWEFAEGAGDDVTDINGVASDDYAESGAAATSPTWDSLKGVQPAGDGAWRLPVAVNEVFQLDRPTTVIVAFWLEISRTAETIMMGPESLFSAGVDNNTEGNGPAGGGFYIYLTEGGGTFKLNSVYRNNGPDSASPALQYDFLGASDLEASVDGTYESKFVAMRLRSDGETVIIDQYQDGDKQASFTQNVDGTGPMALPTDVPLCVIGGRIISKNDTTPSFRLPLNAANNAFIRNTFLYRKDGATDSDTQQIISDLYYYKGEPPRAL
jgi:hypothetical protein